MRIYHIAKKEEWKNASRGKDYRGESLQTQGFIHCCTKAQIRNVLDQWFKGQNDLVLVEIDPTKVKFEVRYENLEGGAELFPHIYGPINLDAVPSVTDINNMGTG